VSEFKKEGLHPRQWIGSPAPCHCSFEQFERGYSEYSYVLFIYIYNGRPFSSSLYNNDNYPPRIINLQVHINPSIYSRAEVHEIMTSQPKFIIFDFLSFTLEQLHLEKASIQSQGTAYYYHPPDPPSLQYFIKSSDDPEEEYKMMVDAGSSCVIQPIGLAAYPPKEGRRPYWGIIMRRAEPIKLNEWTLQDIRQAKEAMEAFHKAGMLHGDIHPGNFLRWDSKVVLCDVGCAQKVDSYGHGFEPPWNTSMNYLSPERILHLGESPASVADDKYAMALTIYKIKTGKVPYGVGNDDVEDAVKAGKRVNFDEVTDPDARNLIKALIHV